MLFCMQFVIIAAQSSSVGFFFRSQKAGACLLPNTCLGIAAKLFAQFETQRVGISWKDVSGFPSPDENFNLAWVFYMLLAQSAIFATVTWWVLWNIIYKLKIYTCATVKLWPSFESALALPNLFQISCLYYERIIIICSVAGSFIHSHYTLPLPSTTELETVTSYQEKTKLYIYM